MNHLLHILSLAVMLLSSVMAYGHTAKAVDLPKKRIVLMDTITNHGYEICSVNDEVIEYYLSFDSVSNEVIRTQICPKHKNNLSIRRLTSRYWAGRSYRTSHNKEYHFYPRSCPFFQMYFIREDGECVESFSFHLTQTPAGIPYQLYKYLLNRYIELCMPISHSSQTEPVSPHIFETTYLVLDSGEVYVPGETKSHDWDDIEVVSSNFSAPVTGKAVVILNFDTTGIEVGKDVVRTYDKVVKLYHMSRECTAEETEIIKQLVIARQRKKRIVVSRLTPYKSTNYATGVRFSIITDKAIKE